MSRASIAFFVCVLVAGCSAPEDGARPGVGPTDEVIEKHSARLRHGDVETRRLAAKELARLADERAIGPLIDALADEDGVVRLAAEEGLRKIGGPAIEPLVRTLSSESAFARYSAVKVLGNLRAAGALERVAERLKDVDADVRMRAAWALGEIGGERTIPPLIEALRDEDDNVRTSAAEALKKVTGRDFGPDRDAWDRWRRGGRK